MNKLVLIPIIIGAVLLTVGSGLLAVGIVASNKTSQKVTKTYEITETFNNFNIDVEISDVEFKASEDGTTKVVCNEAVKDYHEVKVENNALNITYVNARKWYEQIFAYNYQRKVTVYLPSAEYGELNYKCSTGNLVVPTGYTFDKLDAKLSTGNVSFKSNVKNDANINASTGDILLADMTATNMNLKASTGKITLDKVTAIESMKVNTSTGDAKFTDCKAKNCERDSSTGKTTFVNTVFAEKLNVKGSTGDVKFDASDASEITVKTSTGDVKGTLLTSKIFICRTDTGKIQVPSSTEGGKCEITTDTGDIIISIK